MIEYVWKNVDVFGFYSVAWILIFIGFQLITTKKFIHNKSVSFVLSTLIVFVSSEFWEIPIFFMAYLRAPGYGSPEIINHLIVGFMAFILLGFTKFKLRRGMILLYDLLFNIVFLLVFPGIISGWILRSGSLVCLFYVFVWELKNR